MRLPATLVKSILLWAAAALLPTVLARIFFGPRPAGAVAVAVGILLFASALGAQRSLRRTLRPSRIRIGPYRVWAIEDASSHVFATQGLLSPEPALWITRGALSLFTPDELVELVRGMKKSARQGGLRFETVLTAWLARLTSRLPAGLREVLFFRQKRSKTILIRDSARAVFWMSIILILEGFYFGRRSGAPRIPEEILRKLEAESRRCVPRLPAALSSHSAVSPWPDAFLTLGRPCLLPRRAVNLRS